MSPGDVTPAMGQQPPSFERSEFETVRSWLSALVVAY